jgi:uncharacterized membrane protein YozB (DUF420 family)
MHGNGAGTLTIKFINAYPPLFILVVFIMFLSFLARLVFLHSATPIDVSQTALTVMLVALGLVFVGVGFGRFTKTKESLLQHRWTLTAAVALTLGAVFLVMLPSAFVYYVDPDVQFFSSLSITTIVHSVVGVPAVVTALIYVFGDLPVKVKKWMRVTAVLWMTVLALGVVLFLQMQELI